MPAVKSDAQTTETRYSSESPPPTSKTNETPPVIPAFLDDPILQTCYRVGSFLGKGGFAWCYEATDTLTNVKYALKIVPKSRLLKAHHTEKVLREIAIHHPLRHKHIVQLYSAFEDMSNIYMVLEYCPMQSLVHVLKKRGCLCEEEVRYYLRQLILGVRYLHTECSVLHRDLKLGNMLLSADMYVKIADFGLAAELHERSTTLCGTPNYIAPEILNKQGHSFATECWAIGCIMYAMLVGNPPFETNTLEDTYRLILDCNYVLPDSISFNAKALIRSLLNPDPSKRSLLGVLNHPFFYSGYTPSCLSPSCAVFPPDFSSGYSISSTLSNLHDIVASLIVFSKSAPAYQSQFFPTAIPSTGIVYVTKWIDYSNRHGFGIQYNNGVVSVVFNDACSILLSPDRRTGRFLSYNNNNGSNSSCSSTGGAASDKSSSSTLNEICFDLNTNYDDQTVLDRVNTVSIFANYMEKNLISAGEEDELLTLSDLTKIPYLIHWHRYADCIVMVFSDGTFQVNFNNSHMKMVLSPLGGACAASSYVLTHIDASRNLRTYALSTLSQLILYLPAMKPYFMRISEVLLETSSRLP